MRIPRLHDAVRRAGRALVAVPALVAIAALAGCAALVTYDTLSVRDLLVDDGDGRLTPYAGVVEPLPQTAWYDSPLPLGRIPVGALPDAAAWLAPYDFDGDRTIDHGEMTQGWLVRAAELRNGRTYAPDALVAYAGVAAHLAAGTRPIPLAGLQLGTEDSQAVHAIIEGFDAGVSALSAVFEVAAEAVSGGGARDSGGGM